MPLSLGSSPGVEAGEILCFPGSAPVLGKLSVLESLREPFRTPPPSRGSCSLAWIHGWSWVEVSCPAYHGSRPSLAISVDPGSSMAPCPFPRSREFALLPPSLCSSGFLLVSWGQESYVSVSQGRYISNLPLSAVGFCLSPWSYRVLSLSSSSLKLLLKAWKRSLQGFILIP